MPRLKAYTDKFGLIKSREFFNDSEILDMLQELDRYCKIRKVYKVHGNGSVEIKITLNANCTRPIYYTRPDGIKIKTLSIHPENYPLIAHYADGRSEIINIH